MYINITIIVIYKMRTNAIDSTAFRCLAEYSNLVKIYSKIYDKDYNYHIEEYLEELISFDTLKQVREKHTERTKYINDRIDKYIEKQKKHVKIKEPLSTNVVDGDIKNENVIINNHLDNIYKIV